MTLERYKSNVITNTESRAFKLLERVYKALEDRGLQVMSINCTSLKSETDQLNDGDRYIGIKTIYRNNGTDEDVSVDIIIMEEYQGKWYKSGKQIAKVRVPKEASDRVITNRINKAVEYLQ